MTETELQQSIDSLLGEGADKITAGVTLQQLARLSSDHLSLVISQLADQAELLERSDPAILGGLLLALHRMSTQRPSSNTTAGQQPQVLESNNDETDERTHGNRLPGLDVAAIERIAEYLPADVPNRYCLLYLLSARRDDESLEALARQLSADPPRNWKEVGQVLSPLMQHDDWSTDCLFPSVLDALPHPSVASAVLDLANFLVRQHRTECHPAESRRETLALLLGAVAGRLAKFEEDPHAFGDSVERVQSVLAEAVALAVSLCDALGLIGSQEATGKLYQAMELRHRRVQCEAAGALAMLGVQDGRQRLIELAAEPSARLRAIQYANELGFEDEIEGRFKSEESTAEAEMALWLSQPANMGVPPSRVEVIDRRLLYWPGYDQPVDCFLIRFEYQFGDRMYSNIGITGPLVFTLSADVADLPYDDIYAVYAGWQAEHPEIFTISAATWNAAQQRLVKPLIAELDRKGFERIQPILLGFFLDENALVVSAERDDTSCLVITDGSETVDFSTQGRLRPMQAEDLWHLFLGRKMLRTFNS